MKVRILSALKLLLFLAIGLFFFWLAFRGQDIEKITYAISHANYFWLFISMVFALISNISRAIRWNMLIHPIGYRPKTVNTFFAVMMGYLANLAVPRLGEITRCTVLNRYEKVPVQALLGTVVAERVVDVISLVIILTLVVLAQFGLLSEFVSNNFLQPIADYVLALLSKGAVFYLIFFGSISLLIFLVWRVASHFKTTKFYKSLMEIMKGFLQGLNTIRTMKNKWLFIGHTIFMWACYTLMAYFCFYCFDFSSHMNMMQGVTAMIFGGLGFVVPVQGGIGAYHYIVTQTMMVYGLTQAQGLAFATICHGAQTLAVIVLGAIGFIGMPFYNRLYKPKLRG